MASPRMNFVVSLGGVGTYPATVAVADGGIANVASPRKNWVVRFGGVGSSLT